VVAWKEMNKNITLGYQYVYGLFHSFTEGPKILFFSVFGNVVFTVRTALQTHAKASAGAV